MSARATTTATRRTRRRRRAQEICLLNLREEKVPETDAGREDHVVRDISMGHTAHLSRPSFGY